MRGKALKIVPDCTAKKHNEVSVEFTSGAISLSSLVTSYLHMKWAKWSFERVGFKVLPAPTGFLDIKPLNMNSFIPNANSLLLSSNALDEWLGYWVYRMLA